MQCAAGLRGAVYARRWARIWPGAPRAMSSAASTGAAPLSRLLGSFHSRSGGAGAYAARIDESWMQVGECAGSAVRHPSRVPRQFRGGERAGH